mmetsp:Transcript_32735/g.72313  ORF Transcript_32735/g.72313 Transcript_32735/m.72313 type:complete len:267 (+) Transcript_32735:1833-2633(+)
MVARQVPVAGFHTLTAELDADISNWSSGDSASVRMSDRWPVSSNRPATSCETLTTAASPPPVWAETTSTTSKLLLAMLSASRASGPLAAAPVPLPAFGRLPPAPAAAAFIAARGANAKLLILCLHDTTWRGSSSSEACTTSPSSAASSASLPAASSPSEPSAAPACFFCCFSRRLFLRLRSFLRASSSLRTLNSSSVLPAPRQDSSSPASSYRTSTTRSLPPACLLTLPIARSRSCCLADPAGPLVPAAAAAASSPSSSSPAAWMA